MAHNEKGFTLVEVLVALTVTALMLTAVYQTVSTASLAREKLSVENARYHMARIVTERIGRELQSLHFIATDERTRFSGGITGGDLELLAFSSTASTPLAKEPGLPARISYQLQATQDDGEDRYRLNRTENAVLAIESGRAYKLADDLSKVEIHFLNNGSWADHWDSQVAKALPEAVKLTLTTGTEVDETVFRTVWQIGDF